MIRKIIYKHHWALLTDKVGTEKQKFTEIIKSRSCVNKPHHVRMFNDMPA